MTDGVVDAAHEGVTRMNKTYSRMCMKCGTFKQEITRTLPNGNIIIKCPKCGKTVEMTQTGHSVPGSERN